MKYLKGLLYFLLFLIISDVKAIHFNTGETINVDSSIHNDSYISCKILNVNAPIKGDLICAAQSIFINDTIDGDLSAAGETVALDGYVSDDIRVFCRSFTIQGTTKGDMIVFCAEGIIRKGTIIEGDLIVYSGNVTCEGTVKGNIIIKGGKITFNGSTDGNVEIKADQLELNGIVKGSSILAANKINIGNNARFSGNVRYWQQTGELPSDNNQFQNGLSFDRSLGWEKERGNSWWYVGFGFLLWHLLFGLLLIVLLNLLFASWFSIAATAIHQEPAKSLAYGLIYFICVPFIVFFLFITVIGFPIALLLMFIYIFTLISGLIIASLVITYWINNKYRKGWNKWITTGVALLTLIVMHFILAIPFLGFLASMLLVFVAFGGLIIGIRKLKEQSGEVVL